MSVAKQKSDIIAWILKLKDASAIKELMEMKKASTAVDTQIIPLRKFGGGEHIFTYVAEDFDAPLEDFNQYMK